MEVIDREKEFWDQHEEFDWMAESSKRDVVAMLPRLEGDVLELCIGSGMLIGLRINVFYTVLRLDYAFTPNRSDRSGKFSLSFGPSF